MTAPFTIGDTALVDMIPLGWLSYTETKFPLHILYSNVWQAVVFVADFCATDAH